MPMRRASTNSSKVATVRASISAGGGGYVRTIAACR
jgi:hypothetical protein